MIKIDEKKQKQKRVIYIRIECHKRGNLKGKHIRYCTN